MAYQGNREIKITGTGYTVSSDTGQRRSIDAMSADESAIVLGLQAADFQVAASVAVAQDSSFRRGPQDTPGLDIEVPVAPGEASALLLEDEDGVLSWRFPDAAQTPSGRRGEGGVDHYRIADTPSAPAPDRRSFLIDWAIETVTKPIRVHVVRFLARRAVSAAVAHIEGSVVPGPVLIEQGLDVGSWRAADISHIAARTAELAKLETPRILLLVHGTFSSTAGSYGALANDPILDRYDIVLGYDHRTLGEDPMANAEAILATLHALDLPDSTVIDAIAYSRGGLVYRSLVEQLAPRSPLRATFGKAVFVGCTNAGTLLAEPDNWKTLLDIYTNALVAAARVGLGVAGAAAATPLVTVAIRTMGAFAQMLSQVAISERRVPGLAAMEPDSALIAQLNGEALPEDFSTRYFTIGTDFNSAAQGASATTRAALAVLNRVTDRLYGQVANDMVVPTQSMSDFGKARQADQFVAIPGAEGIYHTIYFTSDLARRTIAAWLEGLGDIVGSVLSDPDMIRRSGMPDLSMPRPRQTPEDSGFASIERFPFDRGGQDHDSLRRWNEMAKSIIPSSRDTRIEDSIRRGNAGIDFDTIGHGEAAGGGGGAERRGGPSGSPAGIAFPPPDDGVIESADREEAAASSPPPDAEVGSETTERFIAAEMTPYPVIERPVNLYVTVSPDKIAVADNAAAAALDAAVTLARKQTLTIEIVPMLNCEVVGDASHEVSFLAEEDDVIKFCVRGLQPGSAEVLIVARQGSRSVATFTLKPVFVEAAPAPLRAEANVAPASAVAEGRIVLRIYEFKTGDSAVRLQFNLTSDSPEVAELDSLQINGGFSLEGYTSEVIRQVENAWNLRQTGSEQEIYSSFLERMRADAKVRTKALIPDIIRRRLWQFRDRITEIQVISGEPLIPWELMYLSDPDGNDRDGECFFAERALTRWLHNAPLNRRRMRPHEGKCHYVIPAYSDPNTALKGAAAEKAMLVEAIDGITEIPATSNAVRQFLAEDARDCALLHFACHGRTQPNTTIASDLLMVSQRNAQGADVQDPLTWQDVYANADFGPGGGPLVFVNACQTGREGSGIAGPAGFASAFLRPDSRRGAAAFIGALWSVDDKLAGQFAAKVYDGLANNLSLGRAVAEAREVCKNSNDFTWLAYTVYANG